MFEVTFKIIEGALKTGWQASSASAVPVRWPNVPWKQTVPEWISLRVIPGDGRQASLGSGKLERQLGIVIVQVFTPKNSGTHRAAQLSDIVSAIYRYRTIANTGVSVIFRAPELGDVAERLDQYQQNVKIPYQAEKLFS